MVKKENEKMDFSKYKYHIECHAHTKPVSRCSEIEPKRLVDVYNLIGYDTVVITNHFDPYWLGFSKKDAVKKYLEGYEQTRDYAQKTTKMKIILGMEIRFTENVNDYMVYGIDEEFVEKCYDYLDGTIEKFYKSMKNDKNVILQAHPFRNNMVLADKRYIDGIEAFNMHPGQNSRVSFACKYLKENKDMLTCGGTDYHHEGHEGSISLVSEFLPENSFDIAKIIKSRDFIFDIHGNKIEVRT